MDIYKKWLSIAIVFILTFSLLSPAAMAEEIPTEPDETGEQITAESIELSEHGPLTLTQGSTFHLTATVSSADTAAVEWTSSDPEIATVENGLITAVATGEATITARVAEASATITVTVTNVTYDVKVSVKGLSNTILNTTTQNISSGTTALDLVKNVLKEQNIPHEVIDGSWGPYIQSIANLASGSLNGWDGWMYTVNGISPDVGLDSYQLKSNDELIVYYGTWPKLSTTNNVNAGSENPAITVDLVGDLFKEDATNIANWTIDTGTTALTPTTISLNSNKQAVITFDGQTKAGTISITASANALIGEKTAETFNIVIGQSSEQNREIAQQAIAKAQQYLIANKDLVTTRVNESSSGYWMLSAMYAAGVDIKNFPWTVAPTAEGTHWSTPINSTMTTGNEVLGTIIGAHFLGLDAKNLKNRNLAEDLLAKKSATGLYTTMWGEPWAMVALSLEKPNNYNQAEHIATALKAQDATTGSFDSVDLTGWWLIALSPYRNQPEVEAAIQKAVAAYHTSFMENGFTDNANTMAAIISGLASVGEDLFSEKWTYEKDGQKINIVTHLINNYQMTDGGIRWKAADTQSNLMALEQVYMAIADALHQKSTYVRFTEGIVTNPSGGGTTPGGGSTENNKPNSGNNSAKPSKGYVSIKAGSSTFLSSSEVQFKSGQTAFDLLQLVTEENDIKINYSNTNMGIYVEGINGLKEFDKGPLSGWMYKVNGEFPEISAGDYVVRPGDKIEWVYTEDLGKDVGGYIEGIEKGTEQPKNSGGSGGSSGGKGSSSATQKEDNKTATTVDSPKTTFTAEDIKQYVQNNVATIVVQDTQGTKLEIPTSTLSSIHLAADEKIVTSVTAQAEGKQIDVNLSIETADGTTKAISTGKAYATITLPITDLTANTVVLQLVNGEYKAVPHKIVDGEIIILTKTGGTFVVIEETVTFKDITEIFNKEEIEFLASRHIIKGVNADEFAPNKPITRAQFAVMISRALGLQASGENPFSDTKGQWYEQDVQALFEAGITTGKTADTFDPEAHITRQQAAAFMARVLTYANFQAPSSTETNFNDANEISAQFKQYIDLLNSLNIMTGKADGTFDPHGSLTRAQMAKILKRTLNIADLM